MSGDVAGLVLAAGASTRMGRPKQLLHYRGATLVENVLDAASSAGLRPIIVVVGHAADDVRRCIGSRPDVTVVFNSDFRSGLATSLHCGIAAMPLAVAAAAVLLGDQPTLAVSVIREVVGAHLRTDRPIVQPRYQGRPGHPVLFARSVWPELLSVSGDRGARDLLDRPDRVTYIDVQRSMPADVDYREDYAALIREDASSRGC